MMLYAVNLQIIAAKPFENFLRCQAQCPNSGPVFTLFEESLWAEARQDGSIWGQDRAVYRLDDLPGKAPLLPEARQMIIPLLGGLKPSEALANWLDQVSQVMTVFTADLENVRYRRFNWDEFRYQALEELEGLVAWKRAAVAASH